MNSRTNREWRRSEDATKLLKKSPSIYQDKMKAIVNADEILSVAKSWIGEAKHHENNNRIVEFARGNLYYKVGENGYVADVLVGTLPDGAALLYDIVDIHTMEITEAPVSKADNYPLSSQHASVIENNISQNEEKVKSEFSDENTRFSIREEDPPKKTIIGYKVFRVKKGLLYPPVVKSRIRRIR